MTQQIIDETVMTEADAASVYALLADGSSWPEWSPLGSFELIEPGEGSPEGLGAVRLFTTGRHKSRERVVTCESGRVFGYELEAGLPLRDYRAVITLFPGEDGTHDQLALDLSPQGARHRLALPPRAGQSSSGRPWRGWRLPPTWPTPPDRSRPRTWAWPVGVAGPGSA